MSDTGFRNTGGASSRGVGKLVGFIAVILLLVVGTAVLLPALRSAKELAMRESYGRGYDVEKLTGPYADGPYANVSPNSIADEALAGMPAPVQAAVKSFVAHIDLDPRLSEGTNPPESIYEARFRVTFTATNPDAAKGDAAVALPLPPEIISLSDLAVTVNGDPSEDVLITHGALIWRGRLDAETPSTIEIGYTAVGKGVYTLQKPPGKIDTFEATLVANRSDLRLLALSLQPDKPVREAGKTTYTWKYERLVYAQPIAIDILGVAPTDRLGELAWLAPIGVLAFGLIAAMAGLAFGPDRTDIWTVLLIVGVFAAAYPLMYFAQDFTELTYAIAGAAAVAVLIIAVRALTLLGLGGGLVGVVVPAAAVMGLTMTAAIREPLQGIAMTVLAVLTLVAMMILLPRMRKAIAAPPAPPVRE